MIIASTTGLALQGSGSGESNYGVRHISRSISFTYSQGSQSILTITANSSTPTNFVVTFLYTWNGENFTSYNGGPQTNYYMDAFYMQSSGYFGRTAGGEWGMYGNGNSWQNFGVDGSTLRTIKFNASGNNASCPSLSSTLNVMISASDFSYLTFS